MQGIVPATLLLQNWGRASVPLTSDQDAPVLDAALDQPGVPVALFLKTDALCDVTLTYGAGTGRIRETIRLNGECRRTMLASHVSVVARSVAGTATITGAVVIHGAQLPDPDAEMVFTSVSIAALGTSTVPALWRRHIRIINVGANLCEVRINGAKWDSLAANASLTIEDYRGEITIFSPAGTTCNVFEWGV